MTPSPRRLAFDDFVLDLAAQRLLRGGAPIQIRPKAWSVLCYLVERPGELVSREALHREVWDSAAVTDDTLTQSIGELRRALGDSPRTPRFIETVHRRGFRFIGPIRPAPSLTPAVPATAPEHGALEPAQGSAFVGRGAERQQLQALWSDACRGARQLAFITGETGIGKTSLVEQFLRDARVLAAGGCVLQGQCVQQHGRREPYMPVLEAIERHVGTAAGAAHIPLIRRVAPHVTALLAPLRHGRDPVEPTDVSYERMLREIGGLLERMAAEAPLVLVLEDLHWSDAATVDLLSHLAQRPDPANLLILGTYRPADAALGWHPIRDLHRSLRVRRRCAGIMLGYLSAPDVDTYLRARFGPAAEPLAPLVRERSDGNPLFVVTLVEALIQQGWLREARGGWVAEVPTARQARVVPDDLCDVISGQLHGVAADDRHLLEAAGAAGVRFDLRIVAAALNQPLEDVESRCERLVRSHLFLQRAEAPAGADADAWYQFVHALQRQVIYDQITDLRRQRLHRSVGEALESTHRDDATEHAAALAMHFERGGLLARAVPYLTHCVARAQRRAAHREAETYVAHALGLLERLPAGPERASRELRLRLLRGVSLNVLHGYSSAAVHDNYQRARTLCAENGDARQLFEVITAAWYPQLGSDDVDGLWRNVAELEAIADRLNATDLRLRAALVRGRSEFWHGNFARATRILGECLDATQQESADERAHTYGVAAVVAAFMQRGLGLWFLGYPEQARTHVRAGLIRAETTGQPFDRASALSQAALLALLCRDGAAARPLAERAAAVCDEHDIAFFRPISSFLAVAADTLQQREGGKPAAIQHRLVEQRAVIGSFVCDMMLAFGAEAHGQARQWDEGLRCADEGIALTETMFERIYAAELWRLKGELLLGKARGTRRRKGADAAHLEADALNCFRRAVEIAERQEAQSLVLRSAVSLARAAARDEDRREALDLLAATHAWFTEGFDAPDLVEAKAILDEIQR